MPAPTELAGLHQISDKDTSTYFTYLIGLAYELTGDEEKAVETYWYLWETYPESPYALLARQKLEKVGP